MTVVDVSTGKYVCNAIVTALSGGSTYTIGNFNAADAGESPFSCPYYDTPADFHGGSYAISASAAGFATAQTQDVEIGNTDSACGSTFSKTVDVTLDLTPSP